LGWKIENDLYWLWLVTDTGPVRVRADPFADPLRISGILHKCLIYRCAGLVSWSFAMLRIWNPGALLRVSFLLILSGRGCRISRCTNKIYCDRIFAPV